MKILMLRPNYAPDMASGIHLAVDLVEDIKKKGFNIKLVAPAPIRVEKEIKEKYNKTTIEINNDGKLEIVRIKNSFSEKGIIARALRMLLLCIKMFKICLKEKNIDVIISHSMPVFLGPLAAIAGKIKKVPVIYWEQDVVSESIKTTLVVGKGIKSKFLYWFASKLEKISSKYSTHIITICEEFKRKQLYFKKTEKQIDIVYNWIDTNQLYPITRDENYLFDKFNLERDKFYVTYCGNLGLPQNVEILIDAAKELQRIDNIQFIIFGNGVRRKQIEKYLENANISNCLLLPLQPLTEASYVYSLGDVGVVIGRKGTSKNGFPSKTWSIMAAGQAMISCFDENSELSNFVKEGNCGITIKPDSVSDLVDAILKMYDNREKTKKYGKNARIYVEKNFSREQSTTQFCDIIKKVIENYKKRKKGYENFSK